MASDRRKPNILITGTPGVGKTTTSALAAELSGLEHINVGELVASKGLHDGWDDEFDCWTLDEDRVCDELEPTMQAGGNIIDFHTCDFFPQRWFDLVVVLRTDNTLLFDRLKGKGYKEKKISENIECEIMQVVLDEARDSYDEGVIIVLDSNSSSQLESNAERIAGWVKNWLRENS